MNFDYIIIQLIGILAWLMLSISYYKEDKNKILIFQIISTILYCIHYYLLGALSGVMICFFEVVRNYSYYKSDKDIYIFLGSLPIYLLIGYFSISKYIDTLPLISSLIGGYVLTSHKKVILIGSIIEFILWIIYDISVGSISCTITDGLVAISNISILIFNKSLFKNEKSNSILCK